MNGSWRLYRQGEPWRRPADQATAVIEMPAGSLVAYSTPVVELLTDAELRRSRPLMTLGPDLLADDFDLEEALRRLRARGPMPLGEALLDQRVAAGIGNVYKSEVAFIERLDPWSPVSAFSDDQLRAALLTARRLLQANVGGAARSTTGRRGPDTRLWVYGRAGRACRRCNQRIRSRRQGEQARTTYWCSRCQDSAGPP
jgi:endonuclease-8